MEIGGRVSNPSEIVDPFCGRSEQCTVMWDVIGLIGSSVC